MHKKAGSPRRVPTEPRKVDQERGSRSVLQRLVEQPVTPSAEYDQIVEALVAIPLVGVVVRVQSRVPAPAELAAVPGAG